MIQIKCTGSETLCLADMKPFQGELKHRTQKQIDMLKQSLIEVGLLQPFIIWNGNIIDGHGRHAALTQLISEDESILATQWPVVRIEAGTIEEACTQLLEMNVKYGNITPNRLQVFLREKGVAMPLRVPITVPRKPLAVKEPKLTSHSVIRIKIEKDKEAEFINIIKQLSYVEIL